jgi:hypothetical protein
MQGKGLNYKYKYHLGFLGAKVRIANGAHGGGVTGMVAAE